MSMIAKFVEVAPDRLAEFLEDPDSVTELFCRPMMADRNASTAMANGCVPRPCGERPRCSRRALRG